MNKVEKGEIVHANLVLKETKTVHNTKREVLHCLNEVVYKEVDGFFYNSRLMKPLKIDKPLEVVKIEVLARLGFENKSQK